MREATKRLIILAIVVVVVGGGGWYFSKRADCEKQISYVPATSGVNGWGNSGAYYSYGCTSWGCGKYESRQAAMTACLGL